MSTRLLLPASALAVLLLAGTVFSYPDGAWPGISTGFFGTVPADSARLADSCGTCHTVAAARPQVSLVPSARILTLGENISVTTSAAGGAVDPQPERNAGGFAADASAGMFTAGSNSQVEPNGEKITHISSDESNDRTWTYGYTAPQQPGLVELFTVVNTVNGNSWVSGDAYAFHGYDPEDTVSTPVRLYVLGTGLESTGPACPDGYGNHPVLGATQVPEVGNQTFGLELAGASTSQPVALLASFNPDGFVSWDLDGIGVPGCSSYLYEPLWVAGATTSAGEARRGEGAAFLPLPIPDDPTLQGLELDLQAVYLDPSAAGIPRPLTVTLTNALRLTVQ